MPFVSFIPLYAGAANVCLFGQLVGSDLHGATK